ncbi:integrase, partial [Pseudomonas syringae pv. actinidiae]
RESQNVAGTPTPVIFERCTDMPWNTASSN